MFTINEVNNMANNDLLIEELGECLEQCRNCSCLATVKQITRTADGNTSLINISETEFEAVTSVAINNNRFYLRINTPEALELKKVLAYRDTVNERGTQLFLQGRANDYILVIDLTKAIESQNVVYIMSYIEPMFITIEDGGLYAVYDFDNMHFSKDNVDFVDVLNEIEYAEEVERFAREREEAKQGDYNENDEYIGNEDILSNDTDINADDDDEDYIQ